MRDLLLGTDGSAFSSPGWSADGRRITFLSHRWGDRVASTEVYVMNADGSGQRNLTRKWGLDRGIFPIWSPDWQKIAFVSNPCTAPGACAAFAQIFLMNADGSGLRRVARGGKVRRIHSGQSVCPCAPVPAWSPDGRRIAFVSFRLPDRGDIYVMNADGSGQRNLTRRDGPARNSDDNSPVWSPDGRRIAFVSERDGNGQIYLMNADGSGLRRLTGKGGA